MRSRFQTFLLFGLFVLASCASVVDDPIGIGVAPDDVERGKALVKGLAACGFCHGERRTLAAVLQGGLTVYDRYGPVKAPNITPAKSGIGEWTPRHLVAALRSSVDAEGERISRDVHRGYEWMSDNDLFSIIAYLRTLPPVEHTVERRKLGFYERNVPGFFDVQREVKGGIPDLDRKFDRAYGQYLTDHVARCGSCHNGQGGLFSGEEYLAGGKVVENEKGRKVAPNITGSEKYGIGSWTELDIVKFLKTGMTPDGKVIDPDYCPVRFYREAGDTELSDLARYLKSVGAD